MKCHELALLSIIQSVLIPYPDSNMLIIFWAYATRENCIQLRGASSHNVWTINLREKKCQPRNSFIEPQKWLLLEAFFKAKQTAKSEISF